MLLTAEIIYVGRVFRSTDLLTCYRGNLCVTANIIFTGIEVTCRYVHYSTVLNNNAII